MALEAQNENRGLGDVAALEGQNDDRSLGDGPTLEEQIENQMQGDGPVLEGQKQDPNDMIIISVKHRNKIWEFDYIETETAVDLFTDLEATVGILQMNQKLLIPKGLLSSAPKGLLLKPTCPLDSLPPLRELQGKTLTLLGSNWDDVNAINTMSKQVARLNAARRARAAKPRASRDTQVMTALDAKYTFLVVRPLEQLPQPRRSNLILWRLKTDPGIMAAMRKHEFTVGLLTEMEPLAHTEATHEGTSRILGRNRNKGEVIELRLRTDAHDGYRDYKTIRKTLCHELAHNVHGAHDASFWELCHQIEREVERADWKTSGQTIGESSRYAIQGRDEAAQDEGGWTGGEFTLGGEFRVDRNGDNIRGVSRRQILAAAAVARRHYEAQAEGSADKDQRERQPSQHDEAE
ncbi:hypothetical protein XA68_15349 [Ophiocordyceps unilateralis]|uniref:WLM domain-containing protein n=1 Tax=Ophiocordyceps unilateralis TaxID=268505 RepID=A0A2A9P6S9_OPHUN|nr:hypothetical protein XA68_15349 [Ophiocordyceps unilateralis]